MSESSSWRAELLAELREAHRSEAAPPALRERVLENLDTPAAEDLGIGRVAMIARASSALFTPALCVPALALASLVLLVAFASAFMRGSFAALTLAPEPSAPEGSAPAPWANEPDWSAASGPAPSAERPPGPRPCPLAEVPPNAFLLPEGSPGVVTNGSIFTVRMPTMHCGTLVRRYVQLVPDGLGPNTRAPVLILLHDSGQSAERLRVEQTIWHFDDVATRERLVLVYANAAPSRATQVAIPNSGGWQTDDDAHPEIDDQRYLFRILAELRARRVIAGDNDVYLIGFGGGGRMALAAAAARPDVYTGVAAFMVRHPERVAKPFQRARAVRLTRALFVDRQEPVLGFLDQHLQASAEQWALGMGISPLIVSSQRDVLRRQPPTRMQQRTLDGDSSVWQFDMATPSSGGAAVRVLVLDRGVDPFPLPLGGSGRPPLDAAARSERGGFEGAREAWAFLSGVDGIPSPEGVPPVASDDAAIDDDFGDPPISFPGDVVTVPF
jgi:pimeloyl-ACP methyl ester carboxylesterase